MFGLEGTKRVDLGSRHLPNSGMKKVHGSRKVCVFQGCSKHPSFGEEGGKRAEFCSEHKFAGMVNVRGHKCAGKGCPKSPSFGKQGSKKREFCSEHKRPGMIFLLAKLCASQGCTKHPSFGDKGGKKKDFCNEHKRAGMVDVRSKRCATEGCAKHPSFGEKGSKKMEFCNEHKRTGMVDVRTKRCATEGCTKHPSFGKKRSKKIMFCCEHQRAGMVDVRNKTCTSWGCTRRPSFISSDGSKTTGFCSEHKTSCMVNMRSIRNMTQSVRHFTGRYEAPMPPPVSASASPPSVPTAVNDTRDDEVVEEGAGGQVAPPRTRKRGARVEQAPQQEQQVSGSLDGGSSKGKRRRLIGRGTRASSKEAPQAALVREHLQTSSPMEFMVHQIQDRNGPSPAAQSLGSEERSTPQVHIRLTRSGRGADGVSDLQPASGVPVTVSSQRVPSKRFARTMKREPVVDILTGAWSADEAPGVRGVIIEAGFGHEATASRGAGSGQDISTFASPSRHDKDPSATLACEDQLKIAISEQEKGKAKGEAPHDDLDTAPGGWKDSKGSEKAACKEREALRQQDWDMTDVTAPGPEISESSSHSVMNGLATTASPAALGAASAVAAPEGTGERVPSAGPVDGDVEREELGESIRLYDLKNKGAGEKAVAPLGGLSLSTVAIKPGL